MKLDCWIALLHRRRISWNQKNLDYEIETIITGVACKNTSPWNQKNLDYEIETSYEAAITRPICVSLEIKRTSITRLKRVLDFGSRSLKHFLKSKEPRLRDWNRWTSGVVAAVKLPWNQKNLDYEIETSYARGHKAPVLLAWNQKNLDYEIETWQTRLLFTTTQRLEIKRTSITRLKQIPTKITTVLNLPWNQKNLDYEIETRCVGFHRLCTDLEIKRTSITRLKPMREVASRELLRSWNQKNLDYEIETGCAAGVGCWPCTLEIKRTSITRLKRRWTYRQSVHRCDGLKSKEPRLRDWNWCRRREASSRCSCLKSKEPRLRDWNSQSSMPMTLLTPTLKSKEPRLRDWNIWKVQKVKLTG